MSKHTEYSSSKPCIFSKQNSASNLASDSLPVSDKMQSLYTKKINKKWLTILNQNFNTDKPNQVWVSGTTQLNLRNKPYYVCAIIDLFSIKLISYKILFKNSTRFGKFTFKLAYYDRKSDNGLIFHTDRESTYRSNSFCDYLSSLNVTQLFSRSHVPYDNSVAESLFSSMKRENPYRTIFYSEDDFKKNVKDYINFYNTKGPYAKLNYKTPNQKEEDLNHNAGNFN